MINKEQTVLLSVLHPILIPIYHIYIYIICLFVGGKKQAYISVHSKMIDT